MRWKARKLGYGSDNFKAAKAFVNVPVSDNFGIRLSAQHVNVMPSRKTYSQVERTLTTLTRSHCALKPDGTSQTTLPKFSYDKSKATDRQTLALSAWTAVIQEE